MSRAPPTLYVYHDWNGESLEQGIYFIIAKVCKPSMGRNESHCSLLCLSCGVLYPTFSQHCLVPLSKHYYCSQHSHTGCTSDKSLCCSSQCVSQTGTFCPWVGRTIIAQALPCFGQATYTQLDQGAKYFRHMVSSLSQ